jgi:hypothetical protein
VLRSRVTSGIDVNRLANAVSRPGIDPRVWVSYAVCTSEPVVETRSGQQDVFVDVLLLPSGQPETARVGASYAGNGFGFYAPLHKDDEVLVCAPSGDPDEGLVVTQRLWSPADPPPEAAATYPEDVTLVVEEGKSLRIAVAGDGKVYLGDTEATRGAARLDDEVTLGTALITVLVTVPSPPSGTVTYAYADRNGTPVSTTTVPWAGVPPRPPGVYTESWTGIISTASQKVLVEG